MKGTETESNPTRPETLETLFRYAEARQQPPAEFEKAARAALHQVWTGHTVRRRKHRRAAWGLAAVLLLGLGAGALLQRTPAVPSISVATVDKVLGRVSATSAQGESSPLDVASVVRTAQLLETRFDSSIGLRWQDGISLRLGTGSRLRLLSASAVELLQGSVYVDTDRAQTGGGPFTVYTPAGPLQHVGTRYLAEVEGSRTRVAVREGQVRLEVDHSDMRAGAGEQLSLEPGSAAVRSAVPVYGEMWRWAERLAPPLPEADRSISDFLEWVGHESGYLIEYESPAVESRARETRLVGAVTQEPQRALQLVLKTTDFEVQFHHGVMVIRLREMGG